MSKVLLIADYYLDKKRIASNRTTGLLKYLSEYGWDVHLITTPPHNNILNMVRGTSTAIFIKNDNIGDKNTQIDITIPNPNNVLDNCIITKYTQKISKNIITFIKSHHKLLKIANYIYCSLPNIYEYFWEKSVTHLGDSLCNIEAYDAILSTYGSAVPHICASKLSKKYNLPWVADYRDFWSQNSDVKRFIVTQYCYTHQEKKTLQNSMYLTTVSQPLADCLTSLHNKKVTVIHNGFDPDTINPGIKLRKKFTITYTGNVYSKEFRDPTLLFTAVSELLSENYISSDDIQIDFYGHKSIWLEAEINAYNLSNIVFQHGLVSKEDAISYQRSSQILFVLLWSGDKAEGVLTGKLFEYLGAKRPILATGGNYLEVDAILKKTNTGVALNTLDSLKSQIKSWYDEYKLHGSVLYQGVEEEIDKYSYHEMARLMSTVLNDAINKNIQ